MGTALVALLAMGVAQATGGCGGCGEATLSLEAPSGALVVGAEVRLQAGEAALTTVTSDNPGVIEARIEDGALVVRALGAGRATLALGGTVGGVAARGSLPIEARDASRVTWRLLTEPAALPGCDPAEGPLWLLTDRDYTLEVTAHDASEQPLVVGGAGLLKSADDALQRELSPGRYLLRSEVGRGHFKPTPGSAATLGFVQRHDRLDARVEAEGEGRHRLTARPTSRGTPVCIVPDKAPAQGAGVPWGQLAVEVRTPRICRLADVELAPSGPTPITPPLVVEPVGEHKGRCELVLNYPAGPETSPEVLGFDMDHTGGSAPPPGDSDGPAEPR